MRKWMMAMSVCLITSGCLGNISGSDFATAGGAVLGSTVSSFLGLPPQAAAVITGAGALAGATAVGEQVETVQDQLSELPKEERAAALRWINFWDTIKSLGYWAIAAVLFFFLAPLIIGYFLPNGKQRKMHKVMFDDPNYKMRDM